MPSHINQEQMLRKTKLCRFFEQGACARGRDCNFAHGHEELQAQPNFYRTSLCKSFMRKGWCKKGDACKHAHGQEQLVDLSELPRDALTAAQWPQDPIGLPWQAITPKGGMPCIDDNHGISAPSEDTVTPKSSFWFSESLTDDEYSSVSPFHRQITASSCAATTTVGSAPWETTGSECDPSIYEAPRGAAIESEALHDCHKDGDAPTATTTGSQQDTAVQETIAKLRELTNLNIVLKRTFLEITLAPPVRVRAASVPSSRSASGRVC